jgi:nitrogen regulatory protein P-II 1
VGLKPAVRDDQEHEVAMTKIECIIRPERFEDVNALLNELGIVGMTTSEVRGCGRQRGYVERYRGMEYQVRLLPKMKLELIVRDDQVEDVVQAILKSGRTGEVGDGKIFLTRIDDAIRIRTGERGEGAL